jgi:hypothetical protein
LLNLRFPTCCIMLMSNGQWAPIGFIYNFSSLFNFIWQGLKRICQWFMMMTACNDFESMILTCQSNQSYCRYNVIWHNFICEQWPWAF